jgi:hypothetical protein
MDLKTKLRFLIDQKTRELQVDIDWLRFAQKTGLGYEFLPHDSDRAAALQDICNQAASDYPHLSVGQVQDELANLVNQ